MCLTEQERFALRLIAEDGSKGTAIVAIQVRYHKRFAPAQGMPTCYAIADGLAKLGYIEKSKDASDEYLVTAKGKLFLKSSRIIVSAVLDVVGLLNAIYSSYGLLFSVVAIVFSIYLVIHD